MHRGPNGRRAVILLGVFILLVGSNVLHNHSQLMLSFTAWELQDDGVTTSAEDDLECSDAIIDEFCQSDDGRVACRSNAVPDKMPNLNHLTGETCKTLWFAGFHEGPTSQCIDDGLRGYRSDYARALASAGHHAQNVLQPVLLVSRYGLGANKSVAAVRQWAKEQGGIVITVDQLSFQEDVVRWHPGVGVEHLVGPYLRMEIPALVEKHSLFSLPNVCQQYILYTDCDIVFSNQLSHCDLDILKTYLREKPDTYAMYGRQQNMNLRVPWNTGVMIIDVPRFQKELPAMLRFRNESIGPFPSFDQGLINAYFKQSRKVEQGRTMLPIEWNWKVYWPTPPDMLDKIKIVHFHGPKPGKGYEFISNCVVDMKILTALRVWPHYKHLIASGICCDHGVMARRVWRFVSKISPPADQVC